MTGVQSLRFRQKKAAQVSAAFFGGSGGIRTPVGFHPNGFQDRRVMTTSLRFRIEFALRLYHSNRAVAREYQKNIEAFAKISDNRVKFVAFSIRPCYNSFRTWGYSSVGRALASHVRGQGFDSPYLHQLTKDPIVRVFFLSSRADGGDKGSAPPMTRFSRQSGCTRLRLDTFVSRHSLTAIAVRRLPLSPPRQQNGT